MAVPLPHLRYDSCHDLELHSLNQYILSAVSHASPQNGEYPASHLHLPT